ncbi:MAG TPA: hypothetical protein PLR28_00635 [Dokdonella sp.]|nr:hypothetical protein [Dokdonella sp.]
MSVARTIDTRDAPATLLPMPRRWLRLLRAAAVAVVAVVAPTASAGAAGLANGDFDSNLAGWIPSGTPPAVWSTIDHAGNAASGSAGLSNAEAQANARVYPLRQCIALAGPGTFVIEADGFLAAGHPGGRLVVSYGSHAAADCSGGTGSAGGYFLQSNGAWTHGTATIVMNAGINYLDVSLGIEKDAGAGLLEGNIDAVRVFDQDRIFANGFEAPDLAALP